MSDELLAYYNRELTFIRQMGGEFSLAHPEIAKHLRVDSDGASDDPHIERMIQAFAYLTARVRHKLDDEFPEITSAFLNVLYPHYQAPLPSMSVVQFTLGADQGGLAAGHAVARDSELETDAVDGEPCRFRTCYPLTLWPVTVTAASLGGVQLGGVKFPTPEGATALLRLELRCIAGDMTFSKLKAQSLRFFLKGEAPQMRLLYELLMNEALEVVVSSGTHKAQVTALGKDCLKPVGFEQNESVLPHSPRSFPGYRLLSEYFAFPEKFLFVDLDGLTPKVRAGVGNQLELLIYLRRSKPDLEHSVNKDTFRLGCTPIINLFNPVPGAEPITLSQTELAYRVIPDSRHPKAMEVYSIDSVTATGPNGQEVKYEPFFSVRHSADRRAQQTFWYATREPAEQIEGHDDEGTEVFLSFVDLGFNPAAPANWVVHVTTTCLNRDLPNKLVYGGGRPYMSLRDGSGPVSRIECLTPPTPTHRPPRRTGLMWRIISHLTLNHLSISGGADGANALREILKLYDYVNTPEVQARVSGIIDVGSRRVPFRSGRDIPGAFCRGVEITVELDEDRFADNGLYLFASVLERFLGLYCSINSFSQLVLKTRQRKERSKAMVSEGRRKSPTLTLLERLVSEGQCFEFFQAVRILERASDVASSHGQAKHSPVGEHHPPAEEVVRFVADQSLAFPPSDVVRVAVNNAPEGVAAPPHKMTVAFMGLTGPAGVLPHHYTTRILERLKDHDAAMRDFFDIFNHRLISLFYRASEKYRFPIGYERHHCFGQEIDDIFSRCLFSIVGFETPGQRDRLSFDDEAVLFYSGHFAHQPRSAVALEMLLADYFEVPVQIDQFRGQWLYLTPTDRSVMPSPQHPAGLNNQLGVSTILGDRVWDIQSKFCVRLGPLTFAQYLLFIPTGSGLLPLSEMVRLYVGAEFDFEVRPVLLAAEVPPLRIGAGGASLGRTAWLTSRPFEHDFSDAIFSLPEV